MLTVPLFLPASCGGAQLGLDGGALSSPKTVASQKALQVRVTVKTSSVLAAFRVCGCRGLAHTPLSSLTPQASIVSQVAQ